MPFTYTSEWDRRIQTSKIELEQAETVLKMLRAHGVEGPHPMTTHTIPGPGCKQHTGPVWQTFSDVVEYTKDFPEHWWCDVSHLAMVEARELRRKATEEKAQTIQHPGIRSWVLMKLNQQDRETRGDFEQRDLRSLGKIAQTARGHKPAYSPEPGCSMKLKLSQAVMTGSTQEAYADHTYWAIPVEGEPVGDVAICQRNIRAFASALRTATGLAGEGSTWSMELIKHDGHWLVLANVRSSIAD